MNRWTTLLRDRLTGLQIRPEREAEIIDELSQHLDDHVRELMDAGMDEAQARAAALAELDAPGQLALRLSAIESRPRLTLPPPGTPARGRFLQARLQDVRHSIRSLSRSPVFAITVLVTFSLTIGPTTAILSIGNLLLWRPTPGITDPDRLVRLRTAIWESNGDAVMSNVSNENLADLNRATKTLIGIAGIQESNVNVAGEALTPANAGAGSVTSNVFDILGVPLVAGRTFRPEEDHEPYGEHVTIISSRLATRAFGDPAHAIDQQLLLNGLPMTVVGVVAPSFEGLTPISRVEVWYLGSTYGYVNHFASPRPAGRSSGMFSTFVARLAPGATLQSVQAELDVLVPALAESHPADNKKFNEVRARVDTSIGLETGLRQRYSAMMRILLWVAGSLLLLGCTNVSNMLAVRSVRTARDRAIRLALGASRGRLVLLQLTESVLLAGTGAALGTVLAFWLKDFLIALVFPGVPVELGFQVPVDYRVLAMTLAASMLCGVLAGVIPAITGRRPALASTMAAAGKSVTSRSWVRGSLAGLQFAVSLALIIGALLFVTTLSNLYAVDLGFHASDVTRHSINPTRQGYHADRLVAYYQNLLGVLESRLPPKTVSIAARTPFGSSFRMRLPDPDASIKTPVFVFVNNITPAFFDVLGTKLLFGRTFTDAETWTPATSPSVPVIVAENLARRMFGVSNVVGRTLISPATSMAAARELQIIGVAEDMRLNTVLAQPTPPLQMYQPLSMEILSATVLVRSSMPLAGVSEIVRAAAREIDPSLPVAFSQPLMVEVQRRMADQRVFAWVLSLLGWIAFVLAAVGLYGLMAQSVSERTREFGIRLAVGSGRARIFALVLRQAAWICTAGVAGGLGLAWFGSRAIEAQLYGVSRVDVTTYAMATGVLLLVVFFAGLWPARAATRIQPIEALRVE